jgi:hypothetical protein
MRQERGYAIFGKTSKLKPATLEPSAEVGCNLQQIPA